MAYIPERGDVVWLDFDPTKGHEIQKLRPALVLSTKPFSKVTRLAMVVPVTSTVRGNAFETTLSGKKVSGVVLSQQLRTVDYVSRKAKLVEKAPKAVVDDVLAKVQAILS